MLAVDDIIARLESNRDQIRDFGVRRLALFGSFANGKAKADSDIDFLVDFEDDRGLYDDYIGLYHLLEELFERDIELVKFELVRDELKENILSGKTYGAAV